MYYTGKLCKWGHKCERYTVSGNCRECQENRFRNPEFMERKRIRQREYHQENKRKIREYKRKYYLKNLDKKKIKNRLKKSNRRAHEKRAAGFHKASEIHAMLKAQKGRCAICFCGIKKSGYDIDHIKPLSKGGDNFISNIQLLCRDCNLAKGDKYPYP